MGNENIKKDISEKSQYIEFKEGIFGFEEEKKFLPVMFEDGSDAVLYLQSIRNEKLSFVVMNPFMLKEDYNPVLSEEDYKKLGTSDEKDLSYYVFCVIANVAEESTVNLRCPIVVNHVTRQAVQVILGSDEYGFRHPLKEFEKEEA
ncbi:flagellar assembly protein FliW [Lachnospiraceae bacterium MD308]|jgi:flagellar assembly factor FliW|nr:flagellar assembly protein FliW [Lachnospiraceae bacterium MD308]MCI8581368.1 flagellar assembly protein FliW [Dorea sp.]